MLLNCNQLNCNSLHKSMFTKDKKIPRMARRRNRINVFNDSAPNRELPWYCQANNGYTYANGYTGGSNGVAINGVNGGRFNSETGSTATGPAQVIIYRNDTNNKTLKALFSASNVPGLRELALSDHIASKIYWLVAFLGLGFLCLNDIHQLLSEFYSYPITVDVRLKETRKLPFPLVTVCNLNIVRFSAICNSTLNISIPLELKQKLCGISFIEETTNSSSSDIEDINDILGDAAKKDPNSEAEENHHEEKGQEATTTVPSENNDKNIRGKRQVRGQPQTPVRNKGPPKSGRPVPDPGGGTKGGNRHPGWPEEPLTEEIELTEREEKELQENLTTWLAVMSNVDKNLTQMLGHQFEDMMLRCTMKSNNCTDPRNFKKTFSPSEGNCFTYKSFQMVTSSGGKKQKKSVDISLAGVDHGLELVLNLEVNEYLPGSAQTGALVMVHTSEDFGPTVSEAIFVAPERTTYIGMKMVKITRLPSPYPEHCVDSWPEGMINSRMDKGSYSQQVCLKICLQQNLARNCKCQSATLPQLEVNSTELRFCDTRRKYTRQCVQKVMSSSESRIDGCDCPPLCQVVQYEKTISLAKWPTREDRVTFDSGKTNVNIQNVAKVVVYFQTMTTQEVTQQKAWTTAKLFSSLGGFMGMYVGFSFLSLFEVLDVLLRRLWHACSRRKVSFRATAKAITSTLRIRRGF